jgi:hypothetical protein
MSLGRKAQSGMKLPSREGAAKAEDARTAEAAKTMRLRALRLAKEAADRSSAQAAATTRARFKPSPRVRVQSRSPA